MRRVSIVVLACAFVACTPPEDYPREGTLAAKDGAGHIHYKCTPRMADIVCTFREMVLKRYVGRNGQRGMIEKRALDEAARAKAERMAAAARCEEHVAREAELERNLRGAEEWEGKGWLAAWQVKRRREELTYASAMKKIVCEPGSKEAVEALVKLDSERRERSCSLVARTDEQRFRAQANGSWVHTVEAPEQCGTITVVVFEKNRDGRAWKYGRAKMVGKQGKDGCFNVSEERYMYAEPASELFVGCDYMSVSYRNDGP